MRHTNEDQFHEQIENLDGLYNLHPAEYPGDQFNFWFTTEAVLSAEKDTVLRNNAHRRYKAGRLHDKVKRNLARGNANTTKAGDYTREDFITQPKANKTFGKELATVIRLSSQLAKHYIALNGSAATTIEAQPDLHLAFHKAMWEMIRNKPAHLKAIPACQHLTKSEKFSAHTVGAWPFVAYTAPNNVPTSDDTLNARRTRLARFDPETFDVYRYYANIDNPLLLLHDPVVSSNDPQLIAYFQTPEKRAKGIRTPIKMGRYLTQYDAAFADQSDPGVARNLRDMLSRWTNSTKPVSVFFTPLVSSTDPDADLRREKLQTIWRRIYANGPRSCMKGSSSVKMYAEYENGIKLAYSTTNGNAYDFDALGYSDPSVTAYTFSNNLEAELQLNQPTSRCIVTNDNQWVRIYPEDSGRLWNGTRDTLTHLGYRHGNLDGHYGAYIEDSRGIICPYVDEGNCGDQTVSVETVTLASGRRIQVLEFGGGEYDASETTGYASGGSFATCTSCDCRLDEDEIYYAYDDPYCELCYSDRFVEAVGRSGYRDTYAIDDCIYCESNNEWYVEQYANANNVFQVDAGSRRYVNNWYSQDDVVFIDDQTVHVDDAVELDDSVYESGTYALESDTITTTDGRVIHNDDCIEVRDANGLTHALHKDDDPADYITLPDLAEAA